MIKVYNNGQEFLKENKSYLDTNKYIAVFFYLDAEVFYEASNKNFAIKVEENKKKLLAIKLEPYNICLFGDKECLKDLLIFLKDNNYDSKGFLCPCDLGELLLEISNDLISKRYEKVIGMDFMEATSYTNPSSEEVEVATSLDVDIIYKYAVSFIKECGLPDKPNKDKILNNINNYRVIRRDGIVASMAYFSKSTYDSYRISYVYSEPRYRLLGLARIVVNNIKNEILDMGMIPTLNVDQKNPISNHIYESLGFKKVFSQGVYTLKQKL